MWEEAKENFSIKELLSWDLKDESELDDFRGERAFQVKETCKEHNAFKKLKD